MVLAADSERVRAFLATMPRMLPMQVVRSVLDLPCALEQSAVRVVLFDPNGVPVSFVRSLLGRAGALGRRCYITSASTVRSSELVLQSADRGLDGALLCDCEADRAAMSQVLMAEEAERALPLQLVAMIRLRLLTLPTALRAALVAAATSRCRAGVSVAAFAREADSSPRTIARWLATAELAPPRMTLATLRLAHLGSHLWMPGASIPALAQRCGYASDRTLRAHCERVLGLSPCNLRRRQSEEEILDGLVRALLRLPVADAPEELPERAEA